MIDLILQSFPLALVASVPLLLAVEGELVVERKWSDGRVRLTLFDEQVHNAIISQTNLVNQIPTTTIQTSVTGMNTFQPSRMIWS